MATYIFARKINGTELTGIVDVDNMRPLCYCNEESANIILTALKQNPQVKCPSSIPSSNDPYCDEVMSGRLANFLLHGYSKMVMGRPSYPKLSECPHVSALKGHRNIGPVTIDEYKRVMTRFNFKDKL